VIRDEVCLLLPPAYGAEPERRWWSLRQPPPSVALSLQGRVAAALGPSADLVVAGLLAADRDAEESLRADRQTSGEAAALAAFRRARSGRCVVDPGEPAEAATDRLWAVVALSVARCGQRMDARLLLGEAERAAPRVGTGAEPVDGGYRWTQPGLLHRLLLDCHLRWGGAGEAPRRGSWLAPEVPADSPERALAEATASASLERFRTALDRVLVSADEVALLSALAVLTLFRPF
jgi:hypothetical protein